MKFKIDHDYHIHSKLSTCSNDEQQTAENILKYAEENGIHTICMTDHFWSKNAAPPSKWYAPQDYAHISEILPLPQGESTRFYFGCEADMDKFFNLGITREDFENFDFVIIATTHLHMLGFTIDKEDFSVDRRASLYLERLHRLMNQDLPFKKIGIAHPTCSLLAPDNWEDHLSVLDRISDGEYTEVFTKIAEKGAGFELNFEPEKYTREDLARVLRPHRIAKDVGCKFYFGSDAHHLSEFAKFAVRAKTIVDLLDLREEDKFIPWNFDI